MLNSLYTKILMVEFDYTLLNTVKNKYNYEMKNVFI